METEQQQKALNYLLSQTYMVIATVKADGAPEAAWIGFGVNDQLELTFGTSNKTRKYAAIMQEPKVAAVIGGEQKITVQYEGVAEELSGEALEAYKQAYLSKNPGARQFERNDDQRYFRIKPTWLRYSDYNQGPPEIFELTEFNAV